MSKRIFVKSKKGARVFLGMSGGVDSSVAAYLLKKQGYAVTGVFMRSYNIDGCAAADAEDARRVAEKLGVPFYVWDFEEEYKKKVVEYMVNGYRRGLTPNPDVMCNREIKFGIFMERALALGADYVATGHYVKLRSMVGKIPASQDSLRSASSTRQGARYGISPTTGRIFNLYEAEDKNKDQSYFLWTLTQNELRHCLFPIGGLKKPEVRAIARRAGLATAEKKDSQGICFLGQVTLADFLKEYIPERAGKIITLGGKKIGEHSGAYFYTIGQRHGLDLHAKNRTLGQSGSAPTKPHYVVEKNVRTNTLTVAEGGDNPALYRKEVELTDVNLVYPLNAKRFTLSVMARVRYRQPLAKARLVFSDRRQVLQKKSKRKKSTMSQVVNRGSLIFDAPQKFVAPGQSAVFYSKKGEMLGGGVIV